LGANHPAGVTFDYWNTLIAVGGAPHRERRAEAWVACLADHLVTVSADAVAAAMEEQAAVLDDRWRTGVHYPPGDVIADTAARLGVTDSGIVDALRDAQNDAVRGASFHLAAGVVGVLRRLRAADVRIGIVCDVGVTPSSVLREHLQRHDVLGYFDGLAFSDDVGVYKPDGRIFQVALGSMGVEPGAAAHVGDLRRTDVTGAIAVGMTSVRYAGLFDDADPGGPDAHHVIDHHDQLPGVLGIPT
jgi:putative hydrolase of the HAD superfamily